MKLARDQLLDLDDHLHGLVTRFARPNLLDAGLHQETESSSEIQLTWLGVLVVGWTDSFERQGQ